MSFNIQGAHIADGFADDCDELMHRCLQAADGALTFETFSDIWKEMRLSCVFHGRTSGAEIAELSEELLHIAKHYLVADTSNFEESVVGLFLVYSLMNLQPYSNFASLRIVQEDIPAIERIELVARRDRRQDVLYILGSVLIQGPVQYHAVLRERGMEFPLRKYLEGYATINRLGDRPKGVFYRQNTELDIIKEIKNLNVRYTTAKENIPGLPRDDRNLNYLDANFANDLEKTLKNLISGIIHDSSDDDNSSSSCDHIKNLKNRAMKSQVQPIRHRIGVENRSRNSKPGPSTSNTNQNCGKKRKRTSSSSSGEDSDLQPIDELLSDDELDLTQFNKKETEDPQDEMSEDMEFEAMDAIRGEFVDESDQPSTSESTKDMHKRDLKKTILKSRFKRMGMLPVANFVAK